MRSTTHLHIWMSLQILKHEFFTHTFDPAALKIDSVGTVFVTFLIGHSDLNFWCLTTKIDLRSKWIFTPDLRHVHQGDHEILRSHRWTDNLKTWCHQRESMIFTNCTGKIVLPPVQELPEGFWTQPARLAVRTLLALRVDRDWETAGQTAPPMVSTYSKRHGTYNLTKESFSIYFPQFWKGMAVTSALPMIKT